jgi:O-succinylbenzoic acid--CoA ligase
MLVGGAEIDAGLAERVASLGGRAVSTYGLTETCGGIAYDGRLFEGTQARISAAGSVELRGPTLMDGYRHDPAATAAAFTLDGWLRTGDSGELQADGRLRIDGRSDEAIRTGAETVWPQEVEEALRGHPKVTDIAVAGRPHPEWGQSWRSSSRRRWTIRRAWRSSARAQRSASRGSKLRGSSCW